MRRLSYASLVLFAVAFSSCAASDEDIREEVITVVNNKDIMVDVTDAHVTLSGYVFDAKDTLGFDEKIMKIDGVSSVENNISFFDENVVDE